MNFQGCTYCIPKFKNGKGIPRFYFLGGGFGFYFFGIQWVHP